MRRATSVVLLAAFLPACLELGAGGAAEDDGAAAPESDYGTFTVDADLDGQTCGSGSLEIPATLAFSVALGETDGALTWGSGDAMLRGRLADGGTSFDVSAETVVDMRGPGDEGAPPCRIRRTDEVFGELDGADAPTAFDAVLTIRYAPEPGSDCRDLLFGPERLVQALPCDARYELHGEKTKDGSK